MDHFCIMNDELNTITMLLNHNSFSITTDDVTCAVFFEFYDNNATHMTKIENTKLQFMCHACALLGSSTLQSTYNTISISCNLNAKNEQ